MSLFQQGIVDVGDVGCGDFAVEVGVEMLTVVLNVAQEEIVDGGDVGGSDVSVEVHIADVVVHPHVEQWHALSEPLCDVLLLFFKVEVVSKQVAVAVPSLLLTRCRAAIDKSVDGRAISVDETLGA